MPATVVQMTRRTSADVSHVTDRKRKPGASPAPDSTPPKRGRVTPSSRPPSSQLKPISESSSKANRTKGDQCTAQEVANLKDDLKCSMEDNAGLTKTVEDLQAERNELRAANSELAKKNGNAEELASIRRQVKEQQAENARLKAEQKKQQAELQAAAASLEAARVQAEQEAGELRAALFAAREEAREQGDTLEELTERSRAQEELRRKMHETIQELKGNIRVFCRVKGGSAPTEMGVRCPPTIDSSVIELLSRDASGKRPDSGGMMRYQFDRVFDEATSQADVFKEVSQLTQSALDGFKVCIFAYGQTGSGKTYTMDGPRNQGAEVRGVVPRAAEQAFACAEQLRSLGCAPHLTPASHHTPASRAHPRRTPSSPGPGAPPSPEAKHPQPCSPRVRWEYTFELSCLEIYNEELRDMLNRRTRTLTPTLP